MTVSVHDLACEVSAPLRARRWTADCLRAVLGDAPRAVELVEDAVLCVSELVTNAVSAGCKSLSLRLRVDDATVRVGVIDDAPGHPRPRNAHADDRSGRGLTLVEAVSRRWGVDPSTSGKEVWAEFGRIA